MWYYGEKMVINTDCGNICLAGSASGENSAKRQAIIELSDDQKGHFYSQRRLDGSIEIDVEGNIYSGYYSNFNSCYVSATRLGSQKY